MHVPNKKSGIDIYIVVVDTLIAIQMTVILALFTWILTRDHLRN